MAEGDTERDALPDTEVVRDTEPHALGVSESVPLVDTLNVTVGVKELVAEDDSDARDADSLAELVTLRDCVSVTDPEALPVELRDADTQPLTERDCVVQRETVGLSEVDSVAEAQPLALMEPEGDGE